MERMLAMPSSWPKDFYQAVEMHFLATKSDEDIIWLITFQYGYTSHTKEFTKSYDAHHI